MKKIWKSYGVFTPTAYKIFGLAVIPCIILGLIELFVYANLFSAGISVILFFVYVVWYEVLVDYWIFGGKLIIYLVQDERRPEQKKPRSDIRLRPNL